MNFYTREDLCEEAIISCDSETGKRWIFVPKGWCGNPDFHCIGCDFGCTQKLIRPTKINKTILYKTKGYMMFFEEQEIV